MDKSHHPQVIRPWKTQQIQKNKWSAPPAEPRRERMEETYHLSNGVTGQVKSRYAGGPARHMLRERRRKGRRFALSFFVAGLKPCPSTGTLRAIVA